MTKYLGRLASLLLVAAVASPCVASDGLTLDGPIEVQMRDKHIVVKEPVDVATGFPFNVKAPDDGLFFQWTVPAGVESTKSGNVLKITKAPKGELTISVEYLIVVVEIDWEKKTSKTKTAMKSGSRTLYVGDVFTAPPVVPPPPPVIPPVTPPTTPSPFYFLIVRDDGPASPAFSKIMLDPAWADLIKAGHSYKDKTKTEASSLLRINIPATVPLPAVVRIRVVGNTSTQIGPAIPLPTTSEGIRKLGENP